MKNKKGKNKNKKQIINKKWPEQHAPRKQKNNVQKQIFTQKTYPKSQKKKKNNNNNNKT